ncbi:5-formyltetrahydrofolate cyclo-ligase [Brevundimonas basaltis]|nr:5-formyltetrahydrofolate cyclo-ligase [Brevundimonas basaltis]
MTDKRELRARMRGARKRLAVENPDAAVRAANHADDLPGVVVHALYRPIGSELDPTPLARRLAYEGYDLCLPVVVELNAPMIFRRWLLDQPLEPDLVGVPAPPPLAEIVTPELILTPLLAFDGAGGRLGQGGGYYDRTFVALPDAHRIGFAYAGQEVEHLPLEPHDIRLHGVLTETGYRAVP